MMQIFQKMFGLLSKSEWRQLYILFGAMTVSALIEVVGIASIVPFLSLLQNPGIIQENRVLRLLYSVFNFQDTNGFLIFTGIVVLIILVISNIIAALTFWGLIRFTWMRSFTFSKRLLSKYLYQPYVFFLNKNTSELGKNIFSEVEQVVGGVMISMMLIVSRGIVVVFIIALLTVVNPLLTVNIIAVLGGAYVIVYKLVRNKINHMGQRRLEANTERFKIVNEAFGGIKYLKLMGCENVFIERYSKPSFEYARHNAVNEIITYVPRYAMEIVGFGAVILIILHLLKNGEGMQKAMPLIGLYIFAAYRFMPAFQTIFKGVTAMRFFTHGLNLLYSDMQAADNESFFSASDREENKPIRLQNYLKFEEIYFSYPNSGEFVIENLSLIIKARTSVAFVGATGAGKTTVADIVLGLLRPQKGRIFVDEVEITGDNLLCWQKNLGYIPQDIYLQDDTVGKNIAFGVPYDEIDTNKVEHAARIANIHDFVVEKLSRGYDTIIGERGVRLSGGQRQRIGIARALYHNPQVLVLDEATSALDGATEQDVFTAIKNIALTKTLIIIAHRLVTVRDCDVVYMLEDGRITDQGTYDELIKTNANLRRMAKV